MAVATAAKPASSGKPACLLWSGADQDLGGRDPLKLFSEPPGVVLALLGEGDIGPSRVPAAETHHSGLAMMDQIHIGERFVHRMFLETTSRMLMPFPSPHRIRRGAPPGCTWLDDARACCAARTRASSPCQISRAGCWMARPNENASAQGSRDRNRTFMAFKRAEASSPDWPPDKNAIPGTAAGTTRKRHLTVASATSSTVSCSGQVDPGSTMLGLRIIPSSVTPWA